MVGPIDRTRGSQTPRIVLLVLVGVLVTTVAIQVSRYAGAADASSEAPSAPSTTPAPSAPSDPSTTDPGTTGNGKPPAGSNGTPDSTQSPAPTTPPPGGSSKPSDPGVPYTISGTVSTPLRPGGAPAPIDVSFSSTNVGNGGNGVDGVRVSSLVVTITAVTGPNIGASRPCSTADFVVTQFEGRYPFYVPNGSSSLSSLGFRSGAWPTVRMKDTGSNQNGCKNAMVSLAFTGTP